MDTTGIATTPTLSSCDTSSHPIHCILLRGLAREHAHWGSFVDMLQVAQPNWFIQCLDLPGFGDLSREASPTCIRGMSNTIESTLNSSATSIKNLISHHTPPRIVIALSLGGMVALELLRRQCIDHAITINTSSTLNPFWQRMKLTALPTMLCALVSPSSSQQESLILSQVCNDKHIRKQTLPEWTSIQQKRPISASNTARQLLAASRYVAPAHLDGDRLTLLASNKDKLVSVKCSETLAAHYRAKLIRHPSAGHDIPLEDPDWVIDHCTRIADKVLLRARSQDV